MKKITFHPVTPEAHLEGEVPKPAKSFLPEWYKKLPHFSGGKPQIMQGMANPTVRACMPFYDAMTNGYIQAAWQDMSFEFSLNNLGEEVATFNTPSKPPSFSIRDGEPAVRLSPDYHPFEFVFHPAYYAEVPKGWSLLITQPLNTFDSPLHFTSGITDSDRFTRSGSGNLPFYVKRGFSGIIKKGTPLFQLIPIKRENWKSETASFDLEKQAEVMKPITTKFWGGYKHAYWQKKEFR